MHTVALIAMRHISEGDELVMDYRLDPELFQADWYHPVDMDIIKRQRVDQGHVPAAPPSPENITADNASIEVTPPISGEVAGIEEKKNVASSEKSTLL